MMDVSRHKSVDTLHGYVRRAEGFRDHAGAAFLSTTRKLRNYRADNLMPVLRIFVEARNAALAVGFTDNGGAIHSIERILAILGQRVCYPHPTHLNSLKTDPQAEISIEAHKALLRGEAINIEHVLPQRAFAVKVIEMVTSGATDEAILRFISSHHQRVDFALIQPSGSELAGSAGQPGVPEQCADFLCPWHHHLH